jgi:hypothetical protein
MTLGILKNKMPIGGGIPFFNPIGIPFFEVPHKYTMF